MNSAFRAMKKATQEQNLKAEIARLESQRVDDWVEIEKLRAEIMDLKQDQPYRTQNKDEFDYESEIIDGLVADKAELLEACILMYETADLPDFELDKIENLIARCKGEA